MEEIFHPNDCLGLLHFRPFQENSKLGPGEKSLHLNEKRSQDWREVGPAGMGALHGLEMPKPCWEQQCWCQGSLRTPSTGIFFLLQTPFPKHAALCHQGPQEQGFVTSENKRGDGKSERLIITSQGLYKSQTGQGCWELP